MDRGLRLRRGSIPGSGALGVARIGLAPLADAIDVVRALEVIAVGGVSDPLGLCGGLAGNATVGLEAIELTGPVTGPRYKRVVAAEALDQGPGASHRRQEDATRPDEATPGRRWEEDGEEGRRAAPQAEEDAAKKTPPMPDFKPAESEEFQLGADTPHGHVGASALDEHRSHVGAKKAGPLPDPLASVGR